MIAVYHQCIQYHLVRSKTVGYIINWKKNLCLPAFFSCTWTPKWCIKSCTKKTGFFQHRMKPDTGVSVLGLSHRTTNFEDSRKTEYIILSILSFIPILLILKFRTSCGKPVKNPLPGLKRALDYPCTGHFRFLWCVPEINVLWVAALYKIFAWAEKSCVIATRPHRNRLDETSWAALKNPFFCHTYCFIFIMSEKFWVLDHVLLLRL